VRPRACVLPFHGARTLSPGVLDRIEYEHEHEHEYRFAEYEYDVHVTLPCDTLQLSALNSRPFAVQNKNRE